MTTGIGESDLDRVFFNLSSYAAEPLCWAYGMIRYRLVAPLDPQKFSNSDNKAVEIAKRALIGLTVFTSLTSFLLPVLFTAVALGAISKVFRYLAIALQKNGYTHIQGDAPEKRLENGQAKVMTWNVCGIGAGFHFDYAGVNDWRERVDEIVHKIKQENPDVLVLQEIYDQAFSETLVEKLKTEYAHFFTQLGANVWGGVGGVMILSKCSVNRFTSTSFENNSWKLNRTFSVIDIKAAPEDAIASARIIGTHLIHDDNNARLKQLAQIVNSVAKEPLALPTILTGDLNFERDVPEQGGQLNHYLIHAYQGDEPTCTNELVRQWEGKAIAKPPETIDYISLFKRHTREGQILPVIDQGVEMIDTHLVHAFDRTFNTKTALSDHHGIVTNLRWIPLAAH